MGQMFRLDPELWAMDPFLSIPWIVPSKFRICTPSKIYNLSKRLRAMDPKMIYGPSLLYFVGQHQNIILSPPKKSIINLYKI